MNIKGEDFKLGPGRVISKSEALGRTGKLVFTEDVYDLESLFLKKKTIKLQSSFSNLPLVLAQKEKIDADFKPLAGSELILDVDLICIAVGLRPLAELCWMAGMNLDYQPQLGGFVPLHDESMQSSIDDIYVAGDVAGIEEAKEEVTEIIEKDIEGFVEKNPGLIGKSLKLIKRQFDTPMGRIDLLFEDKKKSLIVVEFVIVSAS